MFTLLVALTFAIAIGFITGIAVACVASVVWVARQWHRSGNRVILVLKALAFTICAGTVTAALFYMFVGTVFLLVAMWGALQYM